MATTARWANRYPVLSDAADVPLHIQNLATDLDNVAKDTQGLLSARPTAVAAKYGAWYFATDTGELARSDGANWITVASGISIAAEIGDYKMSAQIADHGSLGGGKFRWLLLSSPARTPLRADYPLLWDLFRQGTSNSPFGNGNGTTTFALPDLAGRVPVPKGTHTDIDTFGKSDGLVVGSRAVRHKHSGNTGAANLPSVLRNGYRTTLNFTGEDWTTNEGVYPQTIPVTLGPAGTFPNDSAAYIVTGNMFIKAA